MVTTTPSPLRRSERNKNNSSSSTSISPSRTFVSKTHVSKNDENHDVVNSENFKVKKMDARSYRSLLTRQKNKDSHKESNSEDMLIPEDSGTSGGKIDECFKGVSLQCKEVIEDCILPSQDAKSTDMESRSSWPVKELLENNVTLGSMVVPSNSNTHVSSGTPERVQSDCHGEHTSQMSATRDSDSNERLIRKCVGNDKGVNLTPSKRKNMVVDKHSDVSATLVDADHCNLYVDADPVRLGCNVVETSGPSKRIRGINYVDQPTSTSNDEKSCTRNKEGKSGDSVERPQGNNVETEKIRKQQRSLHLSLKPEIEKLCEILLLPDNVKSMVRKFLEYTMNNYKICTEPVSILQAFQLSLCWTAASLLSHKLDTEASLICAKRHLNFTCKKDAVDEINAMLWDLKDDFLLLTGNSDVSCSPKASESSNRVHSNTDTTSSDVELTKKDISRISRNIKENENRKNQWRKLLHMQQENKQKLEKDIRTEKDTLLKRYKLEWGAIRPSYAMRKELLRVFKSEYHKSYAELIRQHEVRLQALETEQLAEKKKFRESLALDELSNLVFLKECGTLRNAPILSPYELSETNCEQVTASELSREEAVGLPSTVRSTDYPENATLNSLSTDQISDGCLDGVVSLKPCSSSSPSNGRSTTISLLNLPSSTQQVPDKVLPNITDEEIPDIVPENSHEEAECQLTDHVVVNESATSDYQEVHRTTTENTLSQEAPVSIPVGPIEPEEQVQVLPLSFVESPRSPVHIIPSPIENATSDYQEVLYRTTTENTLSQEATVSIPVGPIEPEEQVQVLPLPSVESSPSPVLILPSPVESATSDYDTKENTLSQEAPVSLPVGPIEPQEQVQVLPLSSVESPLRPVHILHDNQPNHVSMVMEPPEQVQQLPSSAFISSNQDFSNVPLATGADDRPASNEDALSSPIPEASTEVQNLVVEQHASNLEADSHSRQVVPLVSNMVLESLVPGGVRSHSPDTRSMPTHRVINNHPIRTPAQSVSRNFPSFFYDPLSCELERIRKLTEQNLKKHEDMRLQLKCNFEKEIEELHKKYDIKMKEIDVEYQKERKNYDTQYKTAYAHKILADAIKYNSDNWVSGAPGMQQGAGYTQLSRQQNTTRPALFANPSFRGPPATTFQNSHASTCSQTMVPRPIQAPYNTQGNFNGFPARIPHSNSICSPSGSVQAGGEIHAPPLHLPPYRPSTSQPPSNLGGEIRAPPLHLPPYRPSTSLPPSNLGGEIRASLHLPPYRSSTSLPPSNLGGEIRAPPLYLPPYRPSTSLPPSNLGGEIRTPPLYLPPYRPSTSLPPSNLGGEIRATPPHLSPYRPSTSVLASSLGGEIRAPPPHLTPYRPSTSVLASSIGGTGMPSQPAPSNSPASSLSLDQWLPRPMPTISHSRHGHGNPGVLSTPNLPNMDMHMNSNSQSILNMTNTGPHVSDLTSSNNSQFGTSSTPANSAHEATLPDVVCLLDDD